MNSTNDTISLSHINTIMPLISLMSAHFLVNSFTLISDMNPYPGTIFMKTASNHFLETNPMKSIMKGSVRDEGYIIYDKLDLDLSKVFKKKPKLVVVVHRTDEVTPLSLEFLTKLIIPPSVSFFVVLLPQYERKTPKCFRFYKPSSRANPKSFPVMKYGGLNKTEWVWESKKTNWNSFERETRNMSEVTITIALVSFKEEEVVIKNFWKGKNAFFWRHMKEHLKFRARIHFKKIPQTKSKNSASIYLVMLQTVADGLGVMPVLTPERVQAVGFILTGLDTNTLGCKYLAHGVQYSLFGVYMSRFLDQQLENIKTEPNPFSRNHIMIRAPYYIHSWQSIFKPFASDSWLCLGIVVLLTAASLQIVTSSQNLHSSDFFGSFLTTVGIICGQGCPNIPRGLPARIVCYTCIFFSILIYQFYTSNFYSLLSTKEVTYPFTSLEEFIAKKTHSMYIHPETAVYADIRKAKSGILKKLWDEILSKDPSHHFKAGIRAKKIERVCNGKGAIFGLPFQTLFPHELKCKLVTINSGYFPTNIVTAVRKNFPFKQQFQFVHLRLLEAGISHKYRDQEMRTDRQQAVKTEATNEPVSLEHIAFLFVFLSACVILSSILLGVEVITSKTLRRGRGVNKTQKKTKVRWYILENLT